MANKKRNDLFEIAKICNNYIKNGGRLNCVLSEKGEYIDCDITHAQTIIDWYCMEHKSSAMRDKHFVGSDVVDLEDVCKDTGYIAVAEKGYVGKPNKKQLKILEFMKKKVCIKVK